MLVLEMMLQGKKLAVCSAATKSSVVLCLENLIQIVSFFFPFINNLSHRLVTFLFNSVMFMSFRSDSKDLIASLQVIFHHILYFELLITWWALYVKHFVCLRFHSPIFFFLYYFDFQEMMLRRRNLILLYI